MKRWIRFLGNFIAAAIAVGASATKTNGSDFTSSKIVIPEGVEVGLLLLTWTRAAGSASLTLDFYFQASSDDGATWWDYIEPISDITGHAIISGTTVRIARQISLRGMTHLQLSKIINNDSGNDLTSVNATISF